MIVAVILRFDLRTDSNLTIGLFVPNAICCRTKFHPIFEVGS